MTRLTHHENHDSHPCLEDRYHQCLTFVTTVLACFAVGLIIGDAYEDVTRISRFVGWFSSVAIYTLGLNVLWVATTRHCILMGFSVLMMMVTNLAYVLELFSPPVIDTLFNATSVVIVYLMYRWSNGHCANADNCKSKRCTLSIGQIDD